MAKSVEENCIPNAFVAIGLGYLFIEERYEINENYYENEGKILVREPCRG